MSRKRRTQQKVAFQDKWRIADELWAKIEPLLPPGSPHPLGCHNPPVNSQEAMDTIPFVLHTGRQLNALNTTDICSSLSAQRRYQEWTAAGVFQKLWALGLQTPHRRVGPQLPSPTDHTRYLKMRLPCGKQDRFGLKNAGFP